MKKFLGMLTTFILCFFMMTASAASPNSNSIIENLNGVWYDANGQPGITINISTRNFAGMKIILFDRLHGGGQMYSIRVILDDNGRIKAKWVDYDGNGETKSLKYDGKTYRSTPQILYYESIGGINLHMTRQQVEAMWGAPSSEVKSRALHGGYPCIDVTYASKGIKISYDENVIDCIILQKGSPMHFDRSKLGVKNSLQEFVRAYNVKERVYYGMPFGIGHHEVITYEKDGSIRLDRSL